MGDTVLLATVLKSFRQAHPHATIHWLVSPVNQAIARTVPFVDRIIIWSGGLSSLPTLLGQLRSERYDLICDVEQWARGTAILGFLVHAPARIGFDTPGQHRGNLFTQTVPKRFDRHEIDDFYELLSLPTPLARQEKLELPVTEEGRAEIADKTAFLRAKERKNFVLIHPGCGADGFPREWPLERFAVLAHWLMKKFGAQLVLTSGPEETLKTRRLNRLLKGQAIDLGGKISWNGLVALVAEMDLVISGNTGIMHIAAALQKKQVALHGPTDPKIWGPINPNARVVQTTCDRCPCLKLGFEYHAKDRSCMEKIDVESVKAAILPLFDKKQGI
jgi:ADP-heptose:LPS heptosyltransferase